MSSQSKQILTFGLLSVGVFGFFCLAAIFEEFIFHSQSMPGFKFGWFLTFIQLVFVTLFAIGERKFFGEDAFEHNAPLFRHGIVAGAMTASRGLTNMSLQFLNYPTQVVFKSLKLLTVMLGSVCFVGRSYKPTEYIATLLTVVSAVLFGFGDMKNTKNDAAATASTIGFIIVTLSLFADSLHSNSQETLLQDHKATLRETMIYTNMFAAVFSFLVCLFSGELFRALAFLAIHPSMWFILAFQSLLTYLGVLCFVTIIKKFGVVLATTITTVRKIVTVMLSFIFFDKEFNITYFYGICFFACSFLVQAYVQQQQLKAGLGLGKNVDQQQQPPKVTPSSSPHHDDDDDFTTRPANRPSRASISEDDTDFELDLESIDFGQQQDQSVGHSYQPGYTKVSKTEI